jgi:hypothetical protein
VTLATIAALFGSRTGFAGNGVFHAAVSANGRPADADSDDVAFGEDAADCEEDWDVGPGVLGFGALGVDVVAGGALDVDVVAGGVFFVVCVDGDGVDDGEELFPCAGDVAVGAVALVDAHSTAGTMRKISTALNAGSSTAASVRMLSFPSVTVVVKLFTTARLGPTSPAMSYRLSSTGPRSRFTENTRRPAPSLRPLVPKRASAKCRRVSYSPRTGTRRR